jgi:hypothetical protein
VYLRKPTSKGHRLPAANRFASTAGTVSLRPTGESSVHAGCATPSEGVPDVLDVGVTPRSLSQFVFVFGITGTPCRTWNGAIVWPGCPEVE